jgi:2-oxoglutarate dehydrogenase E2 component (dihydrolipoamide succinyltransferase)
MSVEIRVPALGESVTEATVGQWLKKPGEAVKADEPLVELETDKVNVDVPAPVAGTLAEIKVDKGATVAVGAVLGSIKEGAGAPAQRPTPAAAPAAPAPAAAPPKKPVRQPATAAAKGDMPPSPSARKLLEESGLTSEQVAGSGRRGQVLKGDVMTLAGATAKPAPSGGAAKPAASLPVPAQPMRAPSVANDVAREERVPMTRLRQTIARRLKDAQNAAAMLTTFNDVDMSAVMGMRASYKDLFEKRHGVKLGFMGFFVKACIQALKEVPAVNAEIDGGDIIYKNYYHIGVAVSTERGLVVPVVREADRMSIAEIEGAIADFAKRARDGKLGIEELQGGTFSITNGGVFGSLMSTPILNAPQSGILGMHRIEERPVVKNGQVVARPMMYLALTYDHRIVDGREAVTFLVRVKECLEDPQRFLLEL